MGIEHESKTFPLWGAEVCGAPELLDVTESPLGSPATPPPHRPPTSWALSAEDIELLSINQPFPSQWRNVRGVVYPRPLFLQSSFKYTFNLAVIIYS